MILSNDIAELKESITSDTFRALLISPGKGSSGVYPAETLRDAASLYHKGLKMYLNHPTRTEMRERPERDVTQIAGYLTTGAVWESSPVPGLYATVRILPKYIDLVQSARQVIGLSHMAEGTKVGDTVTKITKVYSVDLVTEPGRGGRICESRRNSPRIGDASLAESEQEYYDSLIRSGIPHKTAQKVVERHTGRWFTPSPETPKGTLTESKEALVMSYIRSGIREDTARKIVSNLR